MRSNAVANLTPVSTNITTNELTEEEKYIQQHSELDELYIKRIRKVGLRRYISTDNAIEQERVMNIELDQVARDKELSLIILEKEKEK